VYGGIEKEDIPLFLDVSLEVPFVPLGAVDGPDAGDIIDSFINCKASAAISNENSVYSRTRRQVEVFAITFSISDVCNVTIFDGSKTFRFSAVDFYLRVSVLGWYWGGIRVVLG
jgi:hypothetical protein